MGCLYLMECEGYTKIGVSTDRDGVGRLATIQGANPFPVELIKDYALVNARRIELALHRMFKDKRVRGEWFRLSKADFDAIEAVISRDGIPMRDDSVDMDLRSFTRKDLGPFESCGLSLRSKNHGKYAFFVGYKQIKELGYVEVPQ